MPRRIKLTLEYDGTDFHGWQSQRAEPGADVPGAVRTVQDEVEAALRALTGQTLRVHGASRTDVGVHAAGQVAHVDLPDEPALPVERLVRALNGVLPPDVSAREAVEVGPEFHARHASRGKLYRYRIHACADRSALRRRTHWHVRFALDPAKMAEAARGFAGTHDFSAFVTDLANAQELRKEQGQAPLQTVREIRRVEVRVSSADPLELEVDVEGGGFLYKMVRTMVGTLVEVGRGRHPPAWIGEVLASRERRNAGPTAPAKGLCLMRVFYAPESGASPSPHEIS
ncbi:MAG: tRNA pseudouridine(38-40) synthase TruA [Planctomycetota bacterium]|nr:tRNA pseudouridine(38-40) synthase TruA [Planctomycetota bacterium]